jgi:Uma2 family endonuclease
VGTSMPEPDAMVVRGQRREYRNRRIRAEDVGLVIEVSDASLERDIVFKKAIYAQAGIPVYWLVNLIDGRIEECTGPTSSAENADYLNRRDYLPADEIPFTLDGNRVAGIPVRDLLP